MEAGRPLLRVEVLGPIRALDLDGRDLTPPGSLQRRLLALLVLRRGGVVSADQAIDVLWPTDPPVSPAAALQNHVSRLRRSLPAGVIESVGDGYRLDPIRIDLDADRLLTAVSEGSASIELDALLTRWTGPAYPELDDTDNGRIEAVRLAELRDRARELRAELRIASGDADGLVAELAALVDADPYRERPRALLMAALAAAGRHVEALRVYDDFRRLLSDELGIEPSPVLTSQHEQILRSEQQPLTSRRRLPVPATSLVGRDALVAEITDLVDRHRLVTLVGPGGMGKTRVLTEAGHRLARRPDRPVVWCELAAAGADSAVDAVAAALAIDARPGVAPVDRIIGVIADAALVLLIDNCEHVLQPIAELVDRIIDQCPDVRVVATSRERLRLPAERVCLVPSLTADTPDAPAVELFVDRARAVMPDFTPDAVDLAHVVEITGRLDGLPLAIELAAARLHTLDVREIAAGLDDRFALLSSGHRSSARHGSLQAVVSWSYDLLDGALQQTFADLSVFAGPFTARDAAAVCGADERTVAGALAQLVERSLVMRRAGGRYVLLETLRAFGAEQLALSDRADIVAGRHARHQVGWLDRADRELLEPTGATLADIDAALPELRTALTWLLDHDETELAGRLAATMLDFGFLRLRPDVMAWSERVIAADPDDRSPVAALVWVVAAFAAWMSGDRAGTAERTERALALATASSDEVPSEVASIRGSVALFDGRLSEAADWYRRAVLAATDDLGQQLLTAGSELLALGYAGDPSAAHRARELLDRLGDDQTPHAAYVWYCAGEAVMPVDVTLATERYERALDLAERTHASFVTGLAGASKASLDARYGDPLVAAAEYRTLIGHWRRAGMWGTQWTVLRSIAALLARLDRPHEAAMLEGAVRATDAGHRIFGEDERALADLSVRLRSALGDDVYAAALAAGARLDGDAAVEHALRSLSAITSEGAARARRAPPAR